jgi:hypothetical protein
LDLLRYCRISLISSVSCIVITSISGILFPFKTQGENNTSSSGSTTSYNWNANDPTLYHLIGRADGNSWSAHTTQDQAGVLSYGPYITNLMPGK